MGEGEGAIYGKEDVKSPFDIDNQGVQKKSLGLNQNDKSLEKERGYIYIKIYQCSIT